MDPIPTNLDWSATAAWIALAISIIGTIAGPLVTTILTNRHQLKLKRLELLENRSSEKDRIIQQAISAIGQLAAYYTNDTTAECGKHFHNVYAYVPTEQWPLLDSFYMALINGDTDTITDLLPQIIHVLAALLAEPPRVCP